MKMLVMAAAALGLLAGEVAAQGWGVGPNTPRVYVPPQPSPPVARPVQPLPPVARPQPPPRPVYRAPPVVVVPGPVYGPPPGWRHRRPYDWCQAKAARLHEFEWRAQQDGRVSRDEMRIARSLRADLANSCGGGRWNPNSGWYYR